MFSIDARRLTELGLMKNVRKIPWEGREIFMGDFVDPLSLERFLNSPRIQYRVFKKDIANHRDTIVAKTKLKRLIGTEVDGARLTMSGLLALAKQAGVKGAQSWLTRPTDRTRFPNTTRTFHEVNGIF